MAAVKYSSIRRVSPVGITGMGLVSAAGDSLPDNLRTLASGSPVPVSPPPFATEHTFPVFRCAVRPAIASALPPTASNSTALAFQAACDALEAAGLTKEEMPFLRFGIVVGTSVGASLTFFDYYRELAAGNTPPLTSIHKYLDANPALALGDLFACPGPVQCVTNACSSGADAIGIGAGWIRSGLCDVVLAGGADPHSYVTYCGFSSLRLPSPEACRPFDARRSGLTLGEGAAFMVLESETARRKRSVPAQAFVAGYGTATDAYHLTAPHPKALGLVAAVDQAFAQAGASWDDIAFVNAHGTATKTNDEAEAAFFAAHCPRTPFIATKGATGHTLGAAGAIEAVFTAAYLAARELPPSPNFSEPDPALGVAPVSTATPVNGPFALSQSLAFGGNNSVLCIAGGDI